MKNTLIDAGPLIALFDADDDYHQPVKHFLKSYQGKLLTTWPVVTEVSHLLAFDTRVQIACLTWIERGGLEIVDIGLDYLSEIIQLMQTHAQVPMDLADASLVVLAELSGLREIITLDSDYYIYRLKNKAYLTNILQPFLP